MAITNSNVQSLTCEQTYVYIICIYVWLLFRLMIVRGVLLYGKVSNNWESTNNSSMETRNYTRMSWVWWKRKTAVASATVILENLNKKYTDYTGRANFKPFKHFTLISIHSYICACESVHMKNGIWWNLTFQLLLKILKTLSTNSYLKRFSKILFNRHKSALWFLSRLI